MDLNMADSLLLLNLQSFKETGVKRLNGLNTPWNDGKAIPITARAGEKHSRQIAGKQPR